MNQTILGIIRAVGYPVLFAAIDALMKVLPTAGFSVEYTTVIVAIIGIVEHQIANSVGYNLPTGMIAEKATNGGY